MLVQDNYGDERAIYFVSKVLKGAKICYQKIERLALAVVITARKLRHYFQGHPIILKMNYPIKGILKKSCLAGRMVAWEVELSEYNITYAPRNIIKSQVLAHILIELSVQTSKEMSEQWIISVDCSFNLKRSGAGI